MSTYTAVEGQTFYDICLITYGSFDFAGRLQKDNGITDLNNTDLSGVQFYYDSSLIVSQSVNAALQNNYGTA